MSGPTMANWVFQFADYATFLLLAAVGLIIILGVVDIINLAHGEFIMLGAYLTTLTYHRGLPLAVAIIVSTITLGAFGLALERLVIRRFYADKIGAMVATWGLSLILSQGILILLGPSEPAIPIPSMTVSWGGYSYDGYRIILMAVAALIVMLMWLALYRTNFGIKVRATMQNPAMARSLGTDTPQIYMVTFAIGSALAGLTGALYAPLSTIVPTMGNSFIAPAFITVVVGGGVNPIVGAVGSSLVLSGISTPVRLVLSSFLGLLCLLLTSLVLIRFLPTGISGSLRDFRRHRIALARRSKST